MLDRQDDRYSNTPETGMYLDRAKPTYIGGLLQMANARLYPFWGRVTEALRTGQPQNETRDGGNPFDALYSQPDRLRQFFTAMTGISMGSARAIAAQFPWREYRTFVDIGCAQGGLPVQLALAHAHLTGRGFDVPAVQPVFEEYVASFGLGDRVEFHPGSFFTDTLPVCCQNHFWFQISLVGCCDSNAAECNHVRSAKRNTPCGSALRLISRS